MNDDLVKELGKRIDNWEEEEFGHYKCDCVPATKKQVRKLARAIAEYLKQR